MRPVGHQRSGICASASGQAVVLGLPDAAAIRAGDRAALAQAKGTVRDEPEPATPVDAVLGVERRQLVRHAGVRIGPADALAVIGEFERMADAGAVRLVHASPDLGADGRANDRADHDGHVALGTALGDLPADRATRDASDGAPKHLADPVAIARARAHAKIVVPGAAAVAGIGRVILLAPAMRGRPARGCRERSARQDHEQRHPCALRQCCERLHQNLPGSSAIESRLDTWGTLDLPRGSRHDGRANE